MNRRRFLAASMPALSLSSLLGWSASGVSAQSKPTSKQAPRRVKIEVTLLAPALNLDHINARTILVITDEDVATYAAFKQMYTYQIKGDKAISQYFGPYLFVTPHIEADGRITVTAKLQYEGAASDAPPNEPLAISSNSMTATRTVESGHSVILGGLAVGGAQEQIQLMATLLDPHKEVHI